MENVTSLSMEEQLRISKSRTEQLAFENGQLRDQLRYVENVAKTKMARNGELRYKIEVLEQKLTEKNRELKNVF